MSELAELDFSQMSMAQQTEYIRRECYEWLKDTLGATGDYYYVNGYYIQDVYLDHPVLGSAVICSCKNELYAIGFELDTASGEIAFDDRGQWVEVIMTYIPINEPGEDAMGEGEISEAVWTTAFVNTLPDSSFAVIMPGGEKDGDGLTKPRSLRKLPYKDKDGKIDLAHLRNALARLPQMKGVSAELKAKAQKVLDAAAKKNLPTHQTESFAESSAGVVELAEADSQDEQGPVKIKIKLLEPGAGNKRDKHYYPRDVLERDIHVFNGAKMYTTDHNQAEKNARTEVGTILECPAGFTETGAPLAIAGVHDPTFAKSIRNRQKLGTLEKLPVSILGNGTAVAGKVDGQDYKIVQSLTEGRDVDFVTRAGAGGQAVSLAESETGIMEDIQEVEINEAAKGGMACPHCGEMVTEAQMKKAGYGPMAVAPKEANGKPMEAAEVQAILAKSGLSELSQGNLGKRTYANEQELREAVLDLKTLLAAEKGGGRPVGVGESATPATIPVLSLAERRKIQDEKMGIPTGGK